ncbi:hypothetical protein [Methanocella arvoryzae]|uniref:Uncharacterized protein n=1 Tax=Methanocella arvoryzae (strain DSM 22066 / NBRC 105507 / MRE50) TaxID=351160 RepID=Q0W281_METAR|nr:hypothetical protein [Methanocella arvoryzae]CAJ37512.1 hypothetical protein RCIX2426 [Methanocella arvoryzae MRE50]
MKRHSFFLIILLMLALIIFTVILSCSSFALTMVNNTLVDVNASYPPMDEPFLPWSKFPPNKTENLQGSSINPDIDPVTYFQIVHQVAAKNTTIINFFTRYGISSIQMDNACDNSLSGYYYVYLQPEKNHSKKLVFLEKWVGANNERIFWIKLVDKDVEFPRLSDSECISLEIMPDINITQKILPTAMPSAISLPNHSANPSPGFNFNTLILIGCLLISSYLLSVIRKNEK